jgi:hypothetical protein
MIGAVLGTAYGFQLLQIEVVQTDQEDVLFHGSMTAANPSVKAVQVRPLHRFLLIYRKSRAMAMRRG